MDASAVCTPRLEQRSPADAPRPAAWRWGICILLFGITVIVYLDRQAMAICSNAICREFGLSNEEFGGLLAAFRWTYAAAQFPAGCLADRFPIRGTYALAVALWSSAGAAIMWVSTGRMLGWARAVLGVGEAFNTPCAMRVTANVLPPEDRALGNGLFNSGSAAGALLAPFLISPIALAWGWRAAFLVVGVLGGVWIAIWWVFARPHLVAGQRPTGGVAGASLAGKLVATLTHPAFWLLVVMSITINPCWYFCADWIPRYMNTQRGFGEFSAGLVTIPIFLGADFGNLAGGGLVKFLTSRRWTLRRARAASSIAAALLVVPVGAAGYVSDAYFSIALLTSAAFGLMALMANYLASVQGFSLADVGLVAGILGALGNVVGAVASPAIGRYVDQTGHYHLVFLLLGLVPLASMAAMLGADALVARSRSPSDPQ
jgi:MFS transporter, ACS family, hexuronate transporter